MRRRIWAIVGASSGNLVEWFDFYVYSFCSLLFGLVWVLLWYFIVSDKPTMSKRLAPEERIDFENHEDVILS
ncbi:hypothetical protein MJM95_31650, partial [Salmonella enterica subsp. enterica serovar Anatum]|nr:hypothetical protein [Salmonella enterica subsp. enterica serovar Anatum]